MGFRPRGGAQALASGTVEDLVASLRGLYTIVIVTHNLPPARRIADDVVVFWVVEGAGTVIEHGPAATLFEAPAQELTAA